MSGKFLQQRYIKPLGIAVAICIIGAILQLTFFAIVLALVIYGLILAWKSGALRKESAPSNSGSADNIDPITKAVFRLRTKLGRKRFFIVLSSAVVAILLIALMITNASQPESMSYGQRQRYFQGIVDEMERDFGGN